MPADTAIAAAESFRAAVLSKQRASLVRLVNGYGAMYQRLQLQIDALTAEIDAMALQGDVTPWKVGKLDRLEALKRQIADEATRYGALVEGEIDAGAREMVAQAQKDAKAIAKAALPGVQQIDAAIMTQWQSLNPEAVQSLLGFLSDESPMRDYLRTKFGPELADVVGKKMLESVALGYNPRKLASALRQATGQGLDWSLRTARTAQLYAYREGSRAAYAANPDVVKGWKWLSARTSNTCFPSGTLIETKRGAVPIESVAVGDDVLTHEGRYRTVTSTMCKPFSGLLVTVCADEYKVSATANHPLLVRRQGKLDWVEAGQVILGDTLFGYADSRSQINQHSVSQPSIEGRVLASTSANPSQGSGKGVAAMSTDAFHSTIISRVARQYHNGMVYNLTVQDDHSYVAGGIVVHNCMACIAQDGTTHKVSETLADHYNGKCAMLPVTVTYRELGLDVDEPPSALEHPTGEDWFKAQPESVQRQMMGPQKWAAWQDGKVSFDRLTTEHTDPVYGKMKSEASLKAILGEAA